MTAYADMSLGKLLTDPRIAPIAGDAIRGWDLSKEALWGKTLKELREEHFFTCEIARGMERLYQAADTGDWYFPLYTKEECAAVPGRTGTNLVWFPSSDPAADGRPFILLVPGGGFVNVWNLTEGWPIAEQFNRLGYHVFILTYQVEGKKGLLKENMQDFSRALSLIEGNARHFHVEAGRYITCGFSAGGYLVCLWNTRLGYPSHGKSKPEATIPVYPVVTLRKDIRYGSSDPAEAIRLYGCSLEEAAAMEYEIPDHTEGFAPCAFFLAAGDTLVNPENSRMLYRALQARGIPCALEIGPEGGHGFADGTGMCMAGWTQRAIRWFESLPAQEQAK